jgi:3-isopropylmalate dehydrogenase
MDQAAVLSIPVEGDSKISRPLENTVMGTYRIAVLPGDGIGPEVMTEALKVLRGVQAAFPGLTFECKEYPTGARCYKETGNDLPPETLEGCRAADAILFGAAGLPDIRFADGTEIAPQLTLRFVLDLYAGIRPIKRYSGVPPVLAGDPAIDYVILRENTEGLYASRGGGIRVGNQVATDSMVITRAGTERIVRYAFRLARARHGSPADGKRRVTCVDKANVLKSMAFFRQIFEAVAREFPEIETDYAYVDAMTLYMVKRPLTFDVVVAENMFGDIISDLAAGTIGGMGRCRGNLRRVPAVARLGPGHRGQGDRQPHRPDPLGRHDARVAGGAGAGWSSPGRGRGHRVGGGGDPSRSQVPHGGPRGGRRHDGGGRRRGLQARHKQDLIGVRRLHRFRRFPMDHVLRKSASSA